MTGPSASPPWQRLPAELADALRPRLEATAEELADAITSAPEIARLRSAKFDHDVRAAARVALRRFVALVGTADPALPPPVREEFVALGAAEAREDRGPDALIAGFRAGSRLLLRSTVRALETLRPVDADVLLDLADAVSTYTDELAAASTDGYALQLREQAGDSDRRRVRLAELLLRGSAPDDVVRTAAAAVGWRTLDQVVAVVLPLGQARDARFRYGADGVVLERERDAVLLLRPGPRATRAALTDALTGRGALVAPTLPWPQVPEAVRLAVLAGELRASSGPGQAGPDPSPEQTRSPEPGRSTEQGGGAAEQSGRTPEQGGPQRPDGPAAAPVFAEDHLATLALRGEQGALAVLAARRLAPFAGLRDARRERLLETLRSWLRHWGARADVSAELFVHPQTVSYRLKILRDLLGDDLDDPTARFELLLVLS